MRLLHWTGQDNFELTRDLTGEQLPRYAILSHTWLLDTTLEVTFEDLSQGTAQTKPEGYAKLLFCGRQAAKDGLHHFWVDTCCIDRGRSAEIQEAIISMFSWYRNADRCYAYLEDVSSQPGDSINEQPPAAPWESAFRRSRWFTRGWTLQELLAPRSVEFFSREGILLGDKTSLESLTHETTGIPRGALRGDPLSNFSVEDRLSWARNRQTKRKEDKAYCLLGIFSVFMTLRYGEEDNAFDRLKRKLDSHREEQASLDRFLSILPVATEAAFNSLHNQHEPTCLGDSRVELLEHIAAWVDNSDDKCVFWLNGIAGTGKSTIARTVARTHYEKRDLGGSFFFSRDGGDLTKATKLATTLARQLANSIPEARHHICEAIREREDIVDQTFRDQWKQLIIGPLSKLARGSPPSTVLLVIDALDECDDENDIRAILTALTASYQSLSNIRLRIFITSRPETPIRHGFDKIPYAEREVYVLHDIDHDLVNRDLNLFFEANLKTTREERGFDNDWPGRRIIRSLVDISCGLFIWAAIACRFIHQGRRLSMADRRIGQLINGISSGSNPVKQLDQIYTAVLRDCIQRDFVDEEEKEESCLILRQVLGAIVILCAPLSIESLSRLLDIPQRDVQETLTDLHTIFNVPDDPSRHVRLHHPTFRDFLLDKERCVDPDFWVDNKQMHKELGDSCLALMSKMLRRNICNLESPGALAKEVHPDQIKRCIPPDLQYACLYWVEHYRRSGTQLADGDEVSEFFKQHFLHWLEVINLMGKGAEMGAIIRLYHSLLQPNLNVRQIPFVKHAREFNFKFQNIIKQTPLQVYCAALAFIAPSNELKRRFHKQLHPWIGEIRIAGADGLKTNDVLYYVSDLAFTPDSKQIASGSNFQSVRVWSVSKKATLRRYESDATDKMSSIAISEDGRSLAGGSDDYTVTVWDYHTGGLRHSIKAHKGWVNSVVFSPDGKLLASGSMDQTLALWDVETGKEVKRFDNKSSCVNSVAYSPDGSLVAMGSMDYVLRLWDVSKDSSTVRVLDGHEGPINAVRFSPSGRQIASGSDDMTIKLWDTATGTERMTLRGHTKKVNAISFSPDACFIASGSEDKTMILWDATSGAILRTFTDHTSGINAVQFSRDGQLLASSSYDDEVRLWDMKTWILLGKFDDFEEDVNSGTLASQQPDLLDPIDMMNSTQDLEGHSSAVTRVTFSPDGRWLASGSQGGQVKLWLDGVERRQIEGHSGCINHFAFSPSSNLVASVSADKTVRILDLDTGADLGTCVGHSDNVLFATVSPDGRLLGSCSTDCTARLWNPETGAPLGVLQGHTKAVTGVAFSPDSRFIMSWSADATALVWDLSTHLPWAALRGHQGPINSAIFSSDRETLVTCSEDATVRFWTKDGAPRGVIEAGSAPIRCVAYSPNDRLLAGCSTSGAVIVWDLRDLPVRGSLETDVAVRRVSFSSCGRYIETDRGTILVESILSSPATPPSPSSSPPSSRPYALFVAREWLRRDMENALWLPEDYQATDVATVGDVIVMGHASGSLSFIHMT